MFVANDSLKKNGSSVTHRVPGGMRGYNYINMTQLNHLKKMIFVAAAELD